MPASTRWRRKSRRCKRRSLRMRRRSRIFGRRWKRRTKNRRKKRRRPVWFDKKKEVQTEAASPRPGGIDYETAGARVTAEDPEVAAAADAFVEAADEEALIVKPEWAIVAVKGCFYPAAKWI